MIPSEWQGISPCCSQQPCFMCHVQLQLRLAQSHAAAAAKTYTQQSLACSFKGRASTPVHATCWDQGNCAGAVVVSRCGWGMLSMQPPEEPHMLGAPWGRPGGWIAAREMRLEGRACQPPPLSAALEALHLTRAAPCPGTGSDPHARGGPRPSAGMCSMHSELN